LTTRCRGVKTARKTGGRMILAFDIGGSRIKAARYDGTLVPLGEMPTPASDFEAFVATLARFRRPRLKGIAISIAGVVDPASGLGTVANIPCIDGLVLAPALEDRLGLPVLVLNDADCFAMAEAKAGAGRGHETVFGIILGTGVGGGLVIDGRVVQGAGGFAGEWGHGPVLHGDLALPCGCGQFGCLDTIGGARGLERLHRLLTSESATSETIVTRWNARDAAAAATMETWRSLLAGPLAMVLNVTGATAVPVGGGLSRATGLVEFLDQAVRSCALRKSPDPVCVPAQCGADAGLLGAALAGAARWP
jgi:N-acetylglucosamine kinase